MAKKTLNTNDVGVLIFFAGIIFGAWFRIMPAWMAGFSINDGGMFYTMILDLQANHYAPPLFTTYNNISIPYAYPPLGFYAGAGISDLFNIPPLAVVRWLPGIVNALSIPAFYFFAKEVLNNKLQSAVAALVYAMIPHLTSWLSMGGGLTRSFGMVFMLFTLGYVHRVFAKNDKRSILSAVIFGGLTVLSHTEAPIYTIAIALYIWAMKSRSLKGILNGALIALGVLIIAAPWYGMIIYRHGAEPFLSALQTGGQTTRSLLRLINIDIITEEPYLDLLGVFGVLGMIFLIIKKQYFIPVMLVLMYLVQPRSAHIVGSIPLALAAGLFITEVLLPAVSKLNETNPNRGIKVFLAILTPYLLINSIYQGFMLSQNHVSNGEQTAMQWIKENTPADSQFLVLTGEPEVLCESSAEWFPALTERTSLSTLQGREWLLGNKFEEFIGHRAGVQNCIDERLECLEREAGYFGANYDYIYISIKTPTYNCKPTESSNQTTRGLVIALEDNVEYSIVYRSEDTVIFNKIK